MATNNETKGEWTTLAELPEGAVFETESGTRAVKSEYHYDNGACKCILLDSGEYAHFCNDPGISPQATAYRHNATKVREIIIPDDAPQGDAPATGQGGQGAEGDDRLYEYEQVLDGLFASLTRGAASIEALFKERERVSQAADPAATIRDLRCAVELLADEVATKRMATYLCAGSCQRHERTTATMCAVNANPIATAALARAREEGV